MSDIQPALAPTGLLGALSVPADLLTHEMWKAEWWFPPFQNSVCSVFTQKICGYK